MRPKSKLSRRLTRKMMAQPKPNLRNGENMFLALINDSILIDTIEDIEEYNLDKAFGRAELCEAIQRMITVAQSRQEPKAK